MAVAAAAAAVDQACKLWLLFVFDLGGRGFVTLTPFLDLVLTWNQGISYGLFRQEGPFGQWAHGAKGIFQFYRELLKTSDLRVMTTYLDYLAAKKVKGHWPCPCRSGKKLRDCHFDQIKELRDNISRRDAERSLATLKAAGASAIEMTEARPLAPITQS